MQKNTGSETLQKNVDHLHGAAIIDAKGNEKPITEAMIQKALEQILRSS